MSLPEITAESFENGRVQEKQQLGGLNGRLRNYVELQKRKQTDYRRMISQLGDVEQKYEQEMNSRNFQLRQMHEEQQGFKHSQRGLISGQKNKAVAARLVCDEFYAKNRNLEADNSLMNQRKSEVETDLSATSTKLQHTSDAVTNVSGQLDEKTRAVSSLNANLGQSKNSHSGLKNRQALVNNQLCDTREKLNRYVVETDSQISALSTELKQRRDAETRIEEELRSEYQTKLEEFIQQRRLAHSAEKEEWMKIFRDEYARKIAAYRNANDDYESQISQLRNDRANLNDKVADLDVKINNIMLDINKFSQEKGRWTAQVAENNDKIKGLRSRLSRKTVDFDAMLKVKANLEAEIGDYWNILGGEETRLGFRGSR